MMSRRSRAALLSHTLRDKVTSWIGRAGFRPGQQLPPEPDLAAELGVSRATLRETLRSLEDEGFLMRTRGAGTFLANRPRVRNNLDANFGVTEAIRASGMRAGIERASTVRRPSSERERERLLLQAGEEVVVVERVRTADGRPVVVSTDVLPAHLLENRRDTVGRLVRGSIYSTLERDLGIAVHHGVATFAPARATASVAASLRVGRGTLLLYLSQIDYDDSGRPVLASDEHHLADAFEFMVIRRGPGRRLE
jgi:GntR family transcriptional regulator